MHGTDSAGIRALPEPTGAYADRPAGRDEAVPSLLVAARATATPRVLTDARSHNLYGPTEAAVDVTFHEMTDTDTLSVPIGTPVFNTRLYVLDSWLRSLPIAGELYLSGVQLARRYLGRAGTTPARFVADSFAGNTVRRTTHCALECLGRSSFQVKPRAWRIELGEIESVLGAVDSVVRVVVVVRDQPGIGERPVTDGVESEPGTGRLAQLPAAATRVAAEVVARLGAEPNCLLGVRELRTATAVTELAELIEQAGGSGGASLVALLRARPRPPLVPLDAVRRHSMAVLLAFGDAEAIAVELLELSVAPSTLDTGVTEFDLQLTVTEYSAGAGLGEGPASAGTPGEFTRATDLFDEARGADYARWQAASSARSPTSRASAAPPWRADYRARPGPPVERFVADPFDPAGGRLYPTGDLAWWPRSVAKRFSGRTDHQVRVRGLRSKLTGPPRLDPEPGLDQEEGKNDQPVRRRCRQVLRPDQ
ncbi:AMP-binding protein [Nocardia sp. NBC_01730]|uniref:AMP-binding protein n=1 Tax=Nocardia sp. NBC_01730 TaxID=2975998 RepID=UPI002E14BFB2|nr:AMP-binding protein [Nocardia sp. NBC_01730]